MVTGVVGERHEGTPQGGPLSPLLANVLLDVADTPQVLHRVDQWLHRRLRMLIVKQQKRGTTLYRTLRARGLPVRLARAAAAHCGRWWAMSAHGALQTAFPTQYFSSLGVPRLRPS